MTTRSGRSGDQPDILLVMADQLAPHFTSTYGHPLVKTPHLDALAERGVRFDAAYCHAPLCAPSRFTMLSGLTASTIDAWDNASEFPASIPTLSHHLRLAGYRTILSGKMHFVGPDQLHGYEERLTTDIYPADFAWTPNWEKADERIDKWYHNMDVLADAGAAVTTYQIDYDTEVGQTARRRLLDIARDRDDRPFFLTASFIHPHDPYVARPEWWDLYDHDAIDLPDPYDLDTADPHTCRIRAGIQADAVGGSGAAFATDQLRNARHGYYANTSYFDDWLGRLVTTLEEIGRLDRTVIIVTSDHGDMLGDRGVFFKMSFHERSARVPLVMAGPGIDGAADGSTVDNACSLLDLLPTVVDIATDGRGLDDEGATDHVDTGAWAGRSLWPAATGGVDEIDETTGEYMGEMTSHPMFMIRRGRYKFISCATDPDQLYDLEVDPLERNNLITPIVRASGEAGEAPPDPVAGPPALDSMPLTPVSAAGDYRELAASFAAEVVERWDSDAIRERVIESQRRRRILHEAMSTGALTSWDHLPVNDVANAYVRNHQDWAESGPRMRFP
ncbi:MAG: choline-sulfatase [Acidimicrobiia bacterium]|nr:choline-sulfatase [Acidimicrobiia bacterium]